MKQRWHGPIPPPDRPSGIEFVTDLGMFAFLIIGPLIYFGEEIGAAERAVIGWYRQLELWLAWLVDLFAPLLDLLG